MTDTSANMLNMAASPSGTIGKMVGTAVVGAHDALAPYLGYQRFPDDVRNMLLGDQVPQLGTQGVNLAGKLIAGDSAEVGANTPAEALARKLVGTAGTAALSAPGGVTAALAGVAGGAVGDVAGKAVPAWAAPVAEMAGNLVGGAAVGAGRGGINKLLSTDDPLVQAAVQKYNIPLRAGQTADSKFVRYADSQLGNLPGTGMDASNAAQRTAFNRAVSKTFGEDAEKITPQVMQNAKDRIGAGLNAIESTHNVSLAPVLPDLQQIAAKSQGGLTSEEFGVVKRVMNGVLQNMGPKGEITGETFGNLVGHNSPLNVALNSSNSNVAAVAGEIKGALQDALQKSLPDDVAKEYSNLRYQYKNMMTVAPLVNRGTPGDINPALLQSVANRSFKQNAFRGAGDLGELGDIGQVFLKSPPDSGTATRTLINGTLYGDAKTAAKLAAGMTAGRVAGSILRTNPLTAPAGSVANGAVAGVTGNPLLDPRTQLRNRR